MAKKPLPEISHPAFGIMRFDPRLDAYQGTVTIATSKIHMLYVPDDPREPSNCFSRNPLDLNGLKRLFKSASAYATDRLLPLRNKTWREADEPLLNAKSFSSRLKANGLTVYEDGSLVVLFEDGDLFWGHSVVVNVGPRGAMRRATVEG